MFGGVSSVPYHQLDCSVETELTMNISSKLGYIWGIPMWSTPCDTQHCISHTKTIMTVHNLQNIQPIIIRRGLTCDLKKRKLCCEKRNEWNCCLIMMSFWYWSMNSNVLSLLGMIFWHLHWVSTMNIWLNKPSWYWAQWKVIWA